MNSKNLLNHSDEEKHVSYIIKIVHEKEYKHNLSVNTIFILP